MHIDNIQLIIQIVLLVFVIYLAFLKSYFQEKGKNVATKEDVKEITGMVEHVKSEINFLTHKRISIATEQQKTLLDFHSKYHSWLNYIAHCSPTVDAEANGLHKIKCAEESDRLFAEFLLAEASLEVFYNTDTALLDLADKIKLATIEISNLLGLVLIEADISCQKVLVSKQIGDGNKMLEEMNKLYAERQGIVEKFQAARLEKYKQVSSLRWQLISEIKSRLDKLAENNFS